VTPSQGSILGAPLVSAALFLWWLSRGRGAARLGKPDKSCERKY
jgi:hypothetical protein